MAHPEFKTPAKDPTPVVIGSLFGDEGKGRWTDTFARADGYVARYSGGHQAGHTVQLPNGNRFVFSSLSSGTFRGATTIIGPGMVWNPLYLLAEIKKFQAAFPDLPAPKVFIHEDAWMSSPYDAFASQLLEVRRRRYADDPLSGHGSCGFGIWATVWRHTSYNTDGTFIGESPIPKKLAYLNSEARVLEFLSDSRIQMVDFLRSSLMAGPRYEIQSKADWRSMPKMVDLSAESIRSLDHEFYRLVAQQQRPYTDPSISLNLYGGLLSLEPKDLYIKFWSMLQTLRDNYLVSGGDLSAGFLGDKSCVFEGSQGLALDPSLMTYSHTTATPVGLKKAMDEGGRIFGDLDGRSFQPIYTLRTHRTRHGAGPLNVLPSVNRTGRKEKNFAFDEVVLTNLSGAIPWPKDDTNVTNSFQGRLRTAPLDIEQVAAFIREDYAQAQEWSDYKFSIEEPVLAVSHMDVFAGKAKIPVVVGETIQSVDEETFLNLLEVTTGYEVRYLSSKPSREE